MKNEFAIEMYLCQRLKCLILTMDLYCAAQILYSELFLWGANFCYFVVHPVVTKFSTHKNYPHTVAHVLFCYVSPIDSRVPFLKAVLHVMATDSF